MTLKEKFDNVFVEEKRFDSENAEQIADDFAIEFAEWVVWKRNFDKEIYHLSSYKELLEIFKKEKGL